MIERWKETLDMTELREFTGYVYGQENNQICDRMAANQMAENLVERIERLTMDDVLVVLDKWKISKNTWRKMC